MTNMVPICEKVLYKYVNIYTSYIHRYKYIHGYKFIHGYNIYTPPIYI